MTWDSNMVQQQQKIWENEVGFEQSSVNDRIDWVISFPSNGAAEVKNLSHNDPHMSIFPVKVIKCRK